MNKNNLGFFGIILFGLFSNLKPCKVDDFFERLRQSKTIPIYFIVHCCETGKYFGRIERIETQISILEGDLNYYKNRTLEESRKISDRFGQRVDTFLIEEKRAKKTAHKIILHIHVAKEAELATLFNFIREVYYPGTPIGSFPMEEIDTKNALANPLATLREKDSDLEKNTTLLARKLSVKQLTIVGIIKKPQEKEAFMFLTSTNEDNGMLLGPVSYIDCLRGLQLQAHHDESHAQKPGTESSQAAPLRPEPKKEMQPLSNLIGLFSIQDPSSQIIQDRFEIVGKLIYDILYIFHRNFEQEEIEKIVELCITGLIEEGRYCSSEADAIQLKQLMIEFLTKNFSTIGFEIRRLAAKTKDEREKLLAIEIEKQQRSEQYFEELAREEARKAEKRAAGVARDREKKQLEKQFSDALKEFKHLNRLIVLFSDKLKTTKAAEKLKIETGLKGFLKNLKDLATHVKELKEKLKQSQTEALHKQIIDLIRSIPQCCQCGEIVPHNSSLVRGGSRTFFCPRSFHCFQKALKDEARGEGITTEAMPDDTCIICFQNKAEVSPCCRQHVGCLSCIARVSLRDQKICPYCRNGETPEKEGHSSFPDFVDSILRTEGGAAALRQVIDEQLAQQDQENRRRAAADALLAYPPEDGDFEPGRVGDHLHGGVGAAYHD